MKGDFIVRGRGNGLWEMFNFIAARICTFNDCR